MATTRRCGELAKGSPRGGRHHSTNNLAMTGRVNCRCTQVTLDSSLSQKSTQVSITYLIEEVQDERGKLGGIANIATMVLSWEDAADGTRDIIGYHTGVGL